MPVRSYSCVCVLFRTLWRPAARRARSRVGPLAPTGAAVPGGLSIGPLPWLGTSTSNGGTPAVGARQLAFALRCAEKRPHCRRGPPRWRPGRWVRQAGLRAARSSPGTSRRRYPAARDPAVLRGHRPVARATGGKGPREESCACRAGRGTSIGSAHNVRAGAGVRAGVRRGVCAGTGWIRLMGHIACAGRVPRWCGALASPLAAQSTTHQHPSAPIGDRAGVN